MEGVNGYWFEIIMNLIMFLSGIWIGWYFGKKEEKSKKEILTK